MSVRVWPVVAIAVVTAILAGGCDSSSSQPAAQPSDSTSPTESVGVATSEAPELGTCWAVPAASTVDPHYWYDDSSPVPCNKPHTTETAVVLYLTEPTIAEATKLASSLCWDSVRTYVGIDPLSWVPWDFAAFLPSKAEIAHGASWLRCDVFFPATHDHSRVRSTTVEAAGVADDPPAELWACLDALPSKWAQPFVPCDQPHTYEETGTLAFLQGPQRYPTAAVRAAVAQRQCRQSVPAALRNVSVIAAWDPRAGFEPGNGLAGACFMFNPDGKPLPAR